MLMVQRNLLVFLHICYSHFQAIHNKIMELKFRDCYSKIRSVDSQKTINDGVVVQVNLLGIHRPSIKIKLKYCITAIQCA